MTDDNIRITYTVRELLDQIRAEQTEGFARLETNLLTKADKADLMRMDDRLDHHQKDIQALRGWKHDQTVIAEQRWSWKKRLWAALGTLCVILATVFGPFVGAHLHL